MHSFKVNIRICHPENNEHHVRGLTNPNVYRKKMHQLFCYMTLHVSLFQVSYEFAQSKKDGTDQEPIQSSTIADPGYHMGKCQKHN